MSDPIHKRDFIKKIIFASVGGITTLGIALWWKRNPQTSSAVSYEGNGGNGGNHIESDSSTVQSTQISNETNPKEDSPVIKKLELSSAEWKERLTSEQYKILRKEGTERPFTSELNNEKRKGSYHCVGCDLELFKSEMKYDSGTGWPSFFTHIEGHFETKDDYFLLQKRTEYHCARCGGHHGHVFTDGPPPTNERWCNNGVALKFVPAKS